MYIPYLTHERPPHQPQPHQPTKPNQALFTAALTGWAARCIRAALVDPLLAAVGLLLPLFLRTEPSGPSSAAAAACGGGMDAVVRVCGWCIFVKATSSSQLPLPNHHPPHASPHTPTQAGAAGVGAAPGDESSSGAGAGGGLAASVLRRMSTRPAVPPPVVVPAGPMKLPPIGAFGVVLGSV